MSSSLASAPSGSGSGSGGENVLPGVGVFGTGAPTRILVPLLKKQGYQIAAIWGRTLPSADAAANALSIPYATNRIDDVLLRHDVSLVVVLCEPAMHATVAARALGIGKHVCVQSPGGLTQEEAARMVQAAQYYPRLSATVCHGLRFLPGVERLRSAVRAGYLGPKVNLCDVRLSMKSIVGTEYSWLCDDTMGGGALNLFGGHLVDLLHQLCGSKAARVHGIARTFSRTTEDIGGIRHISGDDVATFQMEMANGAFAMVTINTQVDGFQQDILLCGREGHLALRNGSLYGKKGGRDASEELLYSSAPVSDSTTVPACPILPPLYVEGAAEMFRQLAATFRNDECPPEAEFSTFEDAQYCHAVLEAVRAADRDRKWIKVCELAPKTQQEQEEELLATPSGFFFSSKHNIPQLNMH